MAFAGLQKIYQDAGLYSVATKPALGESQPAFMIPAAKEGSKSKETKETPASLKFAGDFIAGGVSAAVSKTVVAPIER